MVNEALGVSLAVDDLNGDSHVNLVDVQIVINAAVSLVCTADSGSSPAPTITDFNPKTGAIGTLVTATGSNFGLAPQVSMPQQGGGAISLPLSSMTSGSLVFAIPSGAASGAITIANETASATTTSSFTVTPPNSFTLSASPPAASLIQGQSVAYAVQVSSANGFDQLAQLSVTGVPAGVTASFAPASIGAGQTGILTLTAPANQTLTTANLSISATARVQNLPVTGAAAVALAVVAPTTSLLGRTVVSDPLETPLAGVTVTTLGLDGNGNSTGARPPPFRTRQATLR